MAPCPCEAQAKILDGLNGSEHPARDFDDNKPTLWAETAASRTSELSETDAYPTAQFAVENDDFCENVSPHGAFEAFCADDVELGGTHDSLFSTLPVAKLLATMS